MTQTKRKQKRYKHKRKTRRRNHLPKDNIILSSTANNIIQDDLYKTYRSRFINKPSLKTLEELETVLQHTMKKDLVKNNSYSPSINKKLVSIRSVRYHPIFECNDFSALERTVSEGDMKINVYQDGKQSCTSVYSALAKQTFLKALKNDKISCGKLIVPIQYHTNCWFNTLFMCFFISDKGRKFFRFLRQAMIEGKLVNGKEITPKSLRNSMIIFNAAIEAVQNKNSSLTNASLALNTNAIIHSIYRSIPKSFKQHHYGIKDVDEYGNPLAFYNDLIEYIDPTSGVSPKIKILSQNMEVSDFLEGNSKETSDIVIVQLYNSEYSPSYAKAHHLKKRTIVKHHKTTYKLDSAVVRDNTHTHFSCAITCNGREMIYDGAAFTKVTSKRWKNMLNKNRDWKLPGSSNKWNFTKGYQILFYFKH